MSDSFNNSEKHRYWANALGFCAFLAFIILAFRTCSEHDIEITKANQIEKMSSKK
jgi:hypothetical protein